MAKIGEKLWKN